MRTGGQQVSGDFESGNRLFSLHGREVVQEFVEAVPGRKIIEKILHRDPRSAEDRGAPQNPWIAVNDGFKVCHVIPTSLLWYTLGRGASPEIKS